MMTHPDGWTVEQVLRPDGSQHLRVRRSYGAGPVMIAELWVYRDDAAHAPQPRQSSKGSYAQRSIRVAELGAVLTELGVPVAELVAA